MLCIKPPEAPAEDGAEVAAAESITRLDKKLRLLQEKHDRLHKAQEASNKSIVRLYDELAPVVKDVHRLVRRNRGLVTESRKRNR